MTGEAAPPPTIRAFVAGRSGSGKSTFVEKMFLRKFPRQILLDYTGEYEAKGTVPPCYSVKELADVMRSLAPRGQWVITLSMDKSQIPELVKWLVPVPDLRKSPIRAVNGAVLLVDEVDMIAPPRSTSEEVRTLYRRSRHVGLSVISTTQRPAAVSREVSAQSQQAIALDLSEPRDRDYMTDLMRLSVTQVSQYRQWVRAHPHGALWKDLQAGHLLWFPDSGVPQREGPKPAQVSFVDGA